MPHCMTMPLPILIAMLLQTLSLSVQRCLANAIFSTKQC
uniref:Uncharacterized protein n=1 Tax=Anguilla anguilla TaxID=7936 RepID=A0A0E9U0V6_ANGAN